MNSCVIGEGRIISRRVSVHAHRLKGEVKFADLRISERKLLVQPFDDDRQCVGVEHIGSLPGPSDVCNLADKFVRNHGKSLSVVCGNSTVAEAGGAASLSGGSEGVGG